MKQTVICIIATLLTTCAFAQRSSHKHALPVTISTDSHAYRTTGYGDTLHLSNIPGTASTVLYSAGTDSGYLTGTDYWNDQAFAERYDINGEDSSVQVIGIMALFGGTVNPASSDSVTLTVWSQGPQQYITSTLFYSGFPAGVLTAQNVPVAQLGIGPADTLKTFMFDSTTTFLTGSFFAGYSINYNFASLSGDTIGLVSSLDGDRTSAATTLQTVYLDSGSVVDTLINVQNATQWSDNSWYDNYSQNDSLYNDLAIYPIVVIGNPSSVKGITKKSLTFYGNYPNPATDNTNIKFSLANSAQVTIQVMDMAGHVLNTVTPGNLSSGMHVIPVNTASLSAGNYLYLVRTSSGDGMAGKMTIVR